ncbi:MAG: dephospho-CoA kinase [Planctomycetes bacterium]|nr:dephospho-CoA kinase [Planctomycetota bacterium]
MNHSPPVIGLMGGIGSGKSVVAQALKDLGCVVADADANAKAVLLDSQVRDQLVTWWGAEILNADGIINRKAVSDIVFQDEQARKQLEEVVHPRVRQMQEAQFAAAHDGTRAFVIDAPLLLEARLDTLCDVLIFVDSTQETRLQRVMQTRGWDSDELQRREETQIPLDKKRKKADYVLINEGALDAVRSQVKQILEDIHNGRHI